MSELARIISGMGIVMAIIYGTIITLSIKNGNSIILYLICIAANLAVALWFWYVATQPTNDPQAGMGLGPIMLICGLISVVIPIIALAVFLWRIFQH